MRLAILSLVLCGGMMAYGQSTAPGSASEDKAWKGPIATSTWMDFDKIPLSGHTGFTREAKTFTMPNASFFQQPEKAQAEPKMRFQLLQHGMGAALDAPLLAQNDSPSRPNIFRQWPNLKSEPIPTQWFNAKAEPIPTQWRDLKFLPVNQPSASAAMQRTVK